jgi:hypothetical protein
MQRLERLSAQADTVARSRQFRAQRGAGRRGGGLSRSLVSSLFLLLVRLSLLRSIRISRLKSSAYQHPPIRCGALVGEDYPPKSSTTW